MLLNKEKPFCIYPLLWVVIPENYKPLLLSVCKSSFFDTMFFSVPATASLQIAIDELRKEFSELRAISLSKAAFNELKVENEQLKKDLDTVKSTYSRRMRDIMSEVDEEKKIRLSTQVEMERIRKIVAESHV